MAVKRIPLNFFQLVPLEEENEKEAGKAQLNAIKTVLATLPATFLPINLSESRVYLYGSIIQRNGLYFGTLLRNQVANIPPSYDETDAKLEPLPFSNTQGLAYQTSFLFDPTYRILMLESVKNGVGISTVCDFINLNYPNVSIQPALVIDPQKLQDFFNMTTISRFSVKIAKLESGSIFSNKTNTSLGQIIKSADKTNTDTIEYALTAHRKNSLNKGRISGLVRSLLRYNDTEEVQKLLVVGKEDDEGRRESIDLIDQKLRDSIEVERVRLISTFPVDEHYLKMEQTYATHKPHLSIYKTKAV